MGQRVAVLGASKKPERFSFKALKLLQEFGHEVVPVTPKLDELEGLKVAHKLGEVSGEIGTLTMYVNPETSDKMTAEILKLNPKRVIFNPGSENSDLEKTLKQHGIHVIEACTLVLLRNHQFDNA